jgi:hypothetical protein
MAGAEERRGQRCEAAELQFALNLIAEVRTP